jgi:hypothetical protein
VLFAGVSTLAGVMAAIDTDLSSRQVGLATAAIKRQHPWLYQQDIIFGGDLWRFHSPAFQSVMEMVLVPTHYADPTLPLRLMAPIVVMVYLCGMYALLYRQCRSTGASAFVAVLSSTVVATLGGSHWGVGSLASLTPEGIALALSPLAVLGYLRTCDNLRKLPLVFAGTGLLAMLSLAAAANLTVILLLVHLGRNRFSPRSIGVSALCGVTAALAASPYVAYFLALRAQLGQGAPADAQVVAQAFNLAQEAVFYPDILKALLDWELLARVLVLLAAGVAVLAGFERYRTRQRGVWGWWIAAALVMSLGLQGISQLIGQKLKQGPPVIDFVNAFSLMFLALYVLLAQGLTNLFRLVRTHPVVLRWACAAVMAAWMIPSDNMRVFRHSLYNLASPAKEDRLRELWERQVRREELAAIGNWAANNSSPQSVWITDYAQFRMLSRRAVLAVQSDAQYMYYLAPGELRGWIDRFSRQQRLLHPNNDIADGKALGAFASGALNPQPPEWYVIFDVRATPTAKGPLVPVGPKGEHFRAYLLTAPDPDASPAATAPARPGASASNPSPTSQAP